MPTAAGWGGGRAVRQGFPSTGSGQALQLRDAFLREYVPLAQGDKA